MAVDEHSASAIVFIIQQNNTCPTLLNIARYSKFETMAQECEWMRAIYICIKTVLLFHAYFFTDINTTIAPNATW